AAAQGIAEEDWPYLTIDEIGAAHREAGLAARAAARRAECEGALEVSMPDLLDLSTPAAAPPEGPSPPAAGPTGGGRGVSAGTVTGVVVGSDLDWARADEPRILVTSALDANVESLLGRIDGVLTARGSLLSHVSILV